MPEIALMRLDVNLRGGSGMELVPRARRVLPDLAIVTNSDMEPAHTVRSMLDGGAG